LLDAPFDSLEAEYVALLAGAAVDRSRTRVASSYKVFLHHSFTGSCRYYPSCADYMSEPSRSMGRPRGIWLGTRASLAATRWEATASTRFPGRDQLMERRVFIAIVLSFLVLYFYQALFRAAPPPARPAASTSPAADACGFGVRQRQMFLLRRRHQRRPRRRHRSRKRRVGNI